MTHATDLPQISVVFIFVNEALSVILRSVHSVVNRTPSRLLKEVILVDDNSDSGEWGPVMDPNSTNSLELGARSLELGWARLYARELQDGILPASPSSGDGWCPSSSGWSYTPPPCLIFTQPPPVCLLLYQHLLLDEAHPKSRRISSQDP